MSLSSVLARKQRRSHDIDSESLPLSSGESAAIRELAVFRGPVFGALLALWLLSGVAFAAWLCYSRHSSYQTDRRQHLDMWCYERAKLFEQHALTTVSQIRTLAGLASVMGKPRRHGNWAWDRCLAEQRWDAYLNATSYARPGNTGATVCVFVTDQERPAFERQYGGPILGLNREPQQRQPLYCPRVLEIHYYRGSALMIDLMQRLPEELAFLRSTGEPLFSYATPIANLSLNLNGFAVGFPILQHPLPPNPTEAQVTEAVIGAAGSVLDLVSMARNVLENVFTPDPSITFEVYDTTDPNGLVMIYGPGPRLIHYKVGDPGSITSASPANATRLWEERAVVPLDLLGGRLRKYEVWCRYNQPSNTWLSWGMPVLWMLLSLVVTTLIAGVAWQQRVVYFASQEGIAVADLLRAQAHTAEQSKSSFVASMSHELRTPMVGIMGLLDALTDMGLSAPQVEDVRAARASAYDTVHLVNRVLDLSKLEARKMGLSCVQFEPRAWLESIVVDNFQAAGKKGVQLVGMVDVNVPVVLEMDTMRLTQALRELIDNAVRYTATGHVLVRVSVFPAATTLEGALNQLKALETPLQASSPPPPGGSCSSHLANPLMLLRLLGRAACGASHAEPPAMENAESEEQAAAAGAGAVMVEGRRGVRGGGRLKAGGGGVGGDGDRGGSGWSEGKGGMQLVVSCEDTGCGIDDLTLEGLFELKGRLESGGAGLGLVLTLQLGRLESGGAGLGLVLTQRLASLMGGRVACLSHPGIGSTFAFSVPLAALPSSPHIPVTIAARTPTAPPPTPHTGGMEGVAVGVVGSDARRRELTGRMLSGLGAQVHLLAMPATVESRVTERPLGEAGRSSHGEIEERRDGDSAGSMTGLYGARRARAAESEGGGEGEVGERGVLREGVRWVVVVGEEDVWLQQSEEESVSGMAGQQCGGNGWWGEHGGGRGAVGEEHSSRMPGVAVVPAGAAACAAAVRVVRRVEGMACSGQVVGAVILAGCWSGEEMGGEEGMGDEEEEERERSAHGGQERHQVQMAACPASAISPSVVICHRPLLSHHLRHAVQLAAFGLEASSPSHGSRACERHGSIAPCAVREGSREQGSRELGSEEQDWLACFMDGQGDTEDYKEICRAEDGARDGGTSMPMQGDDGMRSAPLDAPRGCRSSSLGDVEGAGNVGAESHVAFNVDNVGAVCAESQGDIRTWAAGSRSRSLTGGTLSYSASMERERGAARMGSVEEAAEALAGVRGVGGAGGGGGVRRGSMYVTGRCSLELSSSSSAEAAAAAAAAVAAGTAAAGAGGARRGVRGRSITTTAALTGRDSLSAREVTAVLQGLGVLVVDDTGVNLVVARHTLSRCGAAVATAGSGEDAVRRVKEAMGAGVGEDAGGDEEKAAVDVVLMDLQMPGMDGFMATEAIRAHEQATAGQLARSSEGGAEAAIEDAATSVAAPLVPAVPRVPIVALTADVDEEITRRCLANGFDGILQKPVDPKLLSDLLLHIEKPRRLGSL
ncbi:hypothetical protein CLOM_g9331 [Closterium sp. NIES-68]|nr:hypothetical protein CLOM_g9331 [Closterium sp. NIES-68]GJP69283.1 hypothetical protein CLOP_g225 [Closterium sp. NIES-67]